MTYKDEDDNFYYTEGDCLYVNLIKLGKVRKIGNLTVNLTTGSLSLTIHRTLEQKTNFGWMVSAAPLLNFDIQRLNIIVDRDSVYSLEWATVKDTRKHWTFTPDNGMEKQIVLPDAHWTELKPDLGITV